LQTKLKPQQNTKAPCPVESSVLRFRFCVGFYLLEMS
jgi:hypothetical protein